jgi:hypothetical protein
LACFKIGRQSVRPAIQSRYHIPKSGTSIIRPEGMRQSVRRNAAVVAVLCRFQHVVPATGQGERVAGTTEWSDAVRLPSNSSESLDVRRDVEALFR